MRGVGTYSRRPSLTSRKNPRNGAVFGRRARGVLRGGPKIDPGAAAGVPGRAGSFPERHLRRGPPPRWRPPGRTRGTVTAARASSRTDLRCGHRREGVLPDGPAVRSPPPNGPAAWSPADQRAPSGSRRASLKAPERFKTSFAFAVRRSGSSKDLRPPVRRRSCKWKRSPRFSAWSDRSRRGRAPVCRRLPG